MQIDKREYVKNILGLHSMIEKVFLREYEESSDFPANLNNTHIKAMMFLKFEGEKSMSMVSDKLNMEKGSFTPVANHLIELGYVEKIPDSKDKRVFKLRLKEQGNAIASEVCITHNAYVKKLLECLSEDEKDSYFKAVELINDLTIKMQRNRNNT